MWYIIRKWDNIFFLSSKTLETSSLIFLRFLKFLLDNNPILIWISNNLMINRHPSLPPVTSHTYLQDRKFAHKLRWNLSSVSQLVYFYSLPILFGCLYYTLFIIQNCSSFRLVNALFFITDDFFFEYFEDKKYRRRIQVKTHHSLYLAHYCTNDQHLAVYIN